MSISLKKILKNKFILYICNKDTSSEKIIKVLDIFFKKIFITTSYEEALRIYNDEKPSVIITDLKIKDFNGFDLIQNIRKTDHNIPIIVVTSLKDTNTLIKAVKLNLTDYLLKPVDINTLIYALNNSAKKILNGESFEVRIGKEKYYNYFENSIIKKGKLIKLTKNETLLIELLIDNKNKIVRMEKIKNHIWKNKEVSESAFKTLISRLSNKIGKESITNSFGIGYGIIDN